MLIVDAFNVLHTTGVLPPELADPGVPGLIRLIARSRYASRDLTVVCDGGTGAADSGVRLDHAFVIYSGTNREADDVIEELIDRYHRGNPLEVVSSDARLRRAARRRRAGSIPSERFLHHLVEDGRAPTRARGHALRAQVPLDRYSIEAWLTEFGVPHPPAESQRPTAPSRVVPNPTPTARPRPTKPKRPGRKPPSPSLGTRLDLPMPNRGSEPPPLPEPAPEAPPSPARPTHEGHPSAQGLADLDPLLVEALEEWRDRLSVDDLDMQRWAPDATPIRPAAHPRRGK